MMAATGLATGIRLVLAGLALVFAGLGTPADAAAPPGKVKSGTVFFISHDGKAMTAAHVVTGCRDITIWPPDAASFRHARLLSADSKLDVALLQMDGTARHIVHMALAAPYADEEIKAIGFGADGANPERLSTEARGILIGDVKLPPNDYGGLSFRASLRPGYSGGPLLNEAGELIGLVRGYYTEEHSVGVAVSAPQLIRFLSGKGVNLEPSGNGAILSRAEIDAQLAAATALVQCGPIAGAKPKRK